MAYIDGFLIPVPKERLAEYKAISRKAGKVWKEHGALEYRESVGDDLEHKGLASFVKAAGAKKDELVVFSWIVFKSRAHRDRVNKKVMADARLAEMCKPGAAPFDVKRMAYGGVCGVGGGVGGQFLVPPACPTYYQHSNVNGSPMTFSAVLHQRSSE